MRRSLRQIRELEQSRCPAGLQTQTRTSVSSCAAKHHVVWLERNWILPSSVFQRSQSAPVYHRFASTGTAFALRQTPPPELHHPERLPPSWSALRLSVRRC